MLQWLCEDKLLQLLQGVLLLCALYREANTRLALPFYPKPLSRMYNSPLRNLPLQFLCLF